MDMTDRPNSAARIGGFAAVLLFHALLIYVLVSGLGKQAVQMVIQPIQTQIIQEQAAQPPPPPPPPQPQVVLPPPPFIPLPEIRTQLPPPPKAITAPPSPKPPPKQDFTPSQAPTQTAPSPAPTAAPSVRTGASKIASAGCDIPEKPDISDRIGEKGTVTISVSIGPDGKVVQSAVASSSGFKRLDDAGLAAISLCRFRPATVDGKPEASKSTVRYRFE